MAFEIRRIGGPIRESGHVAKIQLKNCKMKGRHTEENETLLVTNHGGTPHMQ